MLVCSRDLDQQHSSRSGLFRAPFPPWLLVHSAFSLESKGHGASYASVFISGVQVNVGEQIPIQLAEMSPPAFRATFPGVAYQLGNVRPILNASEGNQADDVNSLTENL